MAAASTAPGRVNVLECKADLAMLLGPQRKDVYWRALRSFIHGRISRQQLDKDVAALLQDTPEALHVHNQFIRAIHHNALAQVPPPPAEEGNPSAANASASHQQEWLGQRHRQDQRLALQLIRTLSTSELENLQQFGSVGGDANLQHGLEPYAESFPMVPERQWKKGNTQHHLSGSGSLLLANDPSDSICKLVEYAQSFNALGFLVEVDLNLFAAMASELHALPDFVGLRMRVALVAREHGLSTEIHESCVRLLSAAVELYLKNLVGDCLVHCRKVGDAIPATPKIALVPQQNAVKEAATLAGRDDGEESSVSTAGSPPSKHESSSPQLGREEGSPPIAPPPLQQGTSSGTMPTTAVPPPVNTIHLSNLYQSMATQRSLAVLGRKRKSTAWSVPGHMLERLLGLLVERQGVLGEDDRVGRET